MKIFREEREEEDQYQENEEDRNPQHSRQDKVPE